MSDTWGYWTTVAVTAMPPGWVNVFEAHPPEVAFRVEACAVVLLQERVDQSGDRDTRAVPGSLLKDDSCFDPVEYNDGHLLTCPASEWDGYKESLAAEVATGREAVRRQMLAALAKAGEEGVAAADLLPLTVSNCRALAVRDQLVREGVVTVTQEPRAVVLRLAEADAAVGQ
jgi:hypothetical protein